MKTITIEIDDRVYAWLQRRVERANRRRAGKTAVDLFACTVENRAAAILELYIDHEGRGLDG